MKASADTAPDRRWSGRWRLVRQPDGLYARFCGVVDAFTDVAMDHDAAMACCIDENGCEENEAEHRLFGAYRDAALWDSGVPGSGLDRWRESLAAVLDSHGADWARRHLVDVGFDGWPLPEGA